MAQEDRIKREIELIGKLLAKLLVDLTGMRNKVSFDEMVKETSQTLKENLQLELSDLISESPAAFTKMLEEKKLNDAHLEFLANIFYQLGEKADTSLQAKKYFEKALILYEDISSRTKSFSLERYYKIGEIKKLF